MRAALLFSCCLLGCVMDTSLGNHRASQPAAELDGERRAPISASDAQVLDAAHEAPPPSSDLAGGDAASGGDHPPAAGEPDAAAREPAAEPPPVPDAAPTPTTDTPADQQDAEPPVQEEPPPPAEDPPAAMHACDTATDNPCLLCDQDACCEPRSACLESESCACHLECQRVENPAACREACAAAGERYEPWLACLREHCAQQCAL